MAETVWIGSSYAEGQFAIAVLATWVWGMLLLFFSIISMASGRTRRGLLDRLFAAFLFLQITAGALHCALVSAVSTNEPSNPLLGGNTDDYHRKAVAMYFLGFSAESCLLLAAVLTLHSRYDAIVLKFPFTGRTARRLYVRKLVGWTLWGFMAVFGLVSQALAVGEAVVDVSSMTDARFQGNRLALAIRSTWTAFYVLVCIDIASLSLGLYNGAGKAGFIDNIVSCFMRCAVPFVLLQAIWAAVSRVVTSVVVFPDETTRQAFNLTAQLVNSLSIAVISSVLFIIVANPSWDKLISLFYRPKPTYPRGELKLGP